ncbi:MAG: sulfur carrier protein ThiS [Victivallales bacterium]|nr:sulfur carrier protein ThiS [Victivallales bacterium]
MSVTINGEKAEAAGKLLSDYLKDAGYDIQRIAVELNGEIVPKVNYDSTRLQDGDTVEIVSFVGGG